MKRKFMILFASLIVCALLFQGFPNGLQATNNPTSSGLTEFALKAWRNNWGYVYGTYGRTVTQSLIDGKRAQYPTVFKEVMDDGRTAYEHAQEWIGVRAADCAGLLKAYLWWQGDDIGPSYVSSQDQSADTIYGSAKVKGSISTIPETHGVLVWRPGHIGVYIGNGEVIEARGVEYGVVKTRLADRNWTNWCKYAYLSYPTNGWITVDNEQYFYQNGQYITGLMTIDGKTWLFGSNGARQLGLQTVDGKLRYFPADGSLLTGWQTINGGRYYLSSDSSIVTGWQQIDGKRYRFSEQGVLLEGWQQIDQAVFYLNEGVPATGTIELGGQLMTFNSEGVLQTGWQQTEAGWQVAGRDGRLLTGLQLIGDKIFLQDSDGIRQTGWQSVNDRSYYFDPATGARLDGGLQTIDEKPILLMADGAKSDLAQFVHTAAGTYLSGPEGQPLTGEQEVTGFRSGQEMPVTVRLLFDHKTFALKSANQDVFHLTGPEQPWTLTEMPSPVLMTTEGELPAEPVWLTLDPEIANVDESGQVTATGAGQTLVILVGQDQAYAVLPITVLPDPKSLTLTPESLSVPIGLAASLPVVNLPPELVTFYQLKSSNPETVQVLADGRQIVSKAADSTIKLSFGDQTLLQWVVRGYEPVIGLSLARTRLTLPVGGRFEQLASLVPSQGTRQTITFTSSNPAVGTIDKNGTVLALSTGTTVFTAVSGDHSVSCTLTVSGQYPLLKRGSSGDSVSQMQTQIHRLGYLVGPIDGQFGPMTEFAVLALQRKMNVDLSGQADHLLQEMLNEGLAPAPTALKVENALTSGDQGEQVYAMQTRLTELHFLKSKPGGNFGPLTLQAVKTLQALNGLPVTGNATLTDLGKLFSNSVIAGQAVLSSGSTGYEVQILQERMASLNYDVGQADGIYDVQVESAIRLFQKNYGLTIDGQAGYITQSRVFASTTKPLSETATPEPTTVPTPIPEPEAVLTPDPVTPAPTPEVTPTPAPSAPTELKLGIQDPTVTALEARLVDLGYHLALADVTFDSLTVSSVRSFQQRAGLPVTGAADLTTQQRLAASTAPRSSTLYKYGSYGDAVKRIQQRLITLGHLSGSADGKFGPMTLASVKRYQQSAGLSADGIVGSQTLAKLFYQKVSETLPSAPAPTQPAAPQPAQPDPVVTAPAPSAPTTLTAPILTSVLRKGSRGEAVRQVQRRLIELGYLRGSADGIFGSMTDAAVRSFQRKAGLVVDGLVGRLTISKLFDSSAPRA